MEAIWLTPTQNVLINTYLRSLVVIAILILGFKTTWQNAQWGAVIHNGISLILVRPQL